MPVRRALLISLLVSLATSALLPSARATSTTAVARPASADACRVRARFVEAAVAKTSAPPKPGSITVEWRYVRESSAPTGECAGLKREFSVWIPSGSFSTLSKSFVYPVDLEEPTAGESFRLEIVRRARPVPGWFFAGSPARSEGNSR